VIRTPGTGKEFPIPVGRNPGALRFDLDPSEKLLIVVNQGSDDMAVIRVRTNSLLTIIPVGNHPEDLAVKLF
jgi:YVTN family beta-propeller protein